MILEIACLEQRCSCRSHNGFLTRLGYAEHAERTRLAGADGSLYLDRVGSVSALVEVESDPDYDALHIELNGAAGQLLLKL